MSTDDHPTLDPETAQALNDLDPETIREVASLADTLGADGQQAADAAGLTDAQAREVQAMLEDAADDSAVDQWTRRGTLAAGALGAGALAGGTAGAATSGAAGSMTVGGVTANTYKIAEPALFGGPDGAQSELVSELGGNDEGARYLAEDDTVWYNWTGSAWDGPLPIGTANNPVPEVHSDSVITDEESIGGRKTVSPETHTFDDVMTELSNGQAIHMTGGVYPSTKSYDITVENFDLHLDEDAIIDAPDSLSTTPWLQLQGTDGSYVNLSSDAAAEDTTISINDTSSFTGGEPAFIADDALFHANKAGMNNGELVYIDEVVDGTTLKLRGGLFLDHATADNARIKPITPITGKWEGGKIDLRGSDFSQGQGAVHNVVYADGFETRDIDFITDDSTVEVAQYFQVKKSWRPLYQNITPGTHNNDDEHLFIQPGAGTKHATVKDCDIRWGQVCQFENNGNGPSIRARFENVTSIGGRFSVNSTALEPRFVNCSQWYSHEGVGIGDTDAFKNNGVGTVFINCAVYNCPVNAFLLQGVGERLVGCSATDSATAVEVDSWGDHPDANTQTKRIRGFESMYNDTFLKPIASGHVRVEDPHVVGDPADGDRWHTGYDADVIIDGGYFEGVEGSAAGWDRFEIRNAEINFAGLSGQEFFRDTSTNVNNDLVFENCAVYGDSNSKFVRVENYDNLVVNHCRVPTSETGLNIMIQEDGVSSGGAGNIVVRGNEGRNTAALWSLTSAIDVTDGTNIKSDGTTA